MEFIYLSAGIIIGSAISYLWVKQKDLKNNKSTKALEENIKTLQMELGLEQERFKRSEKDLLIVSEMLKNTEYEVRSLEPELATYKTKLETRNISYQNLSEQLKEETNEKVLLQNIVNEIKIEKESLKLSINSLKKECSQLKEQTISLSNELQQNVFATNNHIRQSSELQAKNTYLKEKLDLQKAELTGLQDKFKTDFENIANKILEEKTEKFTTVNKESLKAILNPLAQNLDQFKKQVEKSYSTESKERFSLGEQVKEMAKLNKIISDEARNLTSALKGEAKTQGNWGEMILENILEKSGLRKNEEYFLEHQLLNDAGNPLRSDSENKKMRPDVVIKYPDNRSVIIDSKVSLNAFSRYLAATDKSSQENELNSHIRAIKSHIATLSSKGYDDYDKALDFVMLFIPSEPAYIAAMQGDTNLWHYAYEKRILLLNPTNLITSLKLIVDLWKREYQNQNALEIANRGAKLYDKFVGFVKNLEDLGINLSRAQEKYNDAFKQLSTGNDNLVTQATKLKKLGIKNKKELSEKILSHSE